MTGRGVVPVTSASGAEPGTLRRALDGAGAVQVGVTLPRAAVPGRRARA
ncbi:hypothetical protein [Streptomyces sp. NPDC090445]